MKAHRLMLLLLCLWMGLAAGLARAELQVNGVGAYTQLGSKEYYIVALYTESPARSVEELQALTGSKRAEIKISVRRWPTYGFAQTWKRDFSINNDLSAQKNALQSLQEFATFPKAPLKLGDQINVETDGETSTRVFFNGDLVMEAAGDDLFNLVTNVWVGPSPPTRQFRSDILAGQDLSDPRIDRTWQRMQLIEMDPERRGLAKRWGADAAILAQQQAAERKAREAAAKRRAAEAEAARQAKLKAQQEAERRRLAEQEAARRAEAAAIAKAEQERKAAAAAAATAAAALAAAEASQEAAAVAAAKAQEEAAQRAKQEAEEALKRQEEERLAAEKARQEAEARAKAETQALALEGERLAYEQAVYVWKLKQEVYKAVIYPEWARQFGEEGDFQVFFTLDAQGALEDITALVPDESSLLAQELGAAVERASPFGPLPEGLGPDSELEVSYAFRLREEAELPSRPQPSASLIKQIEASMTEEKRQTLIANYRKNVQERILQAVEYPHWAKTMRQTGKVKGKVRISPDGEVLSVELIKKTRHPILNEELERAAGRASPFPTMPLGLGVEALDVEVEHQFRR